VCFDKVKDFAAITGLTRDFDSRDLLEQRPDAGAHQCVVIGQQDTDGIGSGVQIGSIHIAPIKTAGCAHFKGNQA
jgi:hypothetical protein